MAKRGPKVKPRTLSLVKGGKKSDTPPPADIPKRERRIIPPKTLDGMQQKIWDAYVEPASWLAQCDSVLAYIFVNLTAEFIEGAAERSPSPERGLPTPADVLRSRSSRVGLNDSIATICCFRTGRPMRLI